MPSIGQVLDLINKGGVAGVLLLDLIVGLYTLHKRIWVPGWYATRIEGELDAYKERMLRGAEIAEIYHDRATGGSISPPPARKRRRADP